MFTLLKIASVPILGAPRPAAPPLYAHSVGSLLGVAGGAVGAMSYLIYDGNAMGRFRHFCIAAAAVSCLGFWWTGTRLDVGRLDTFKRTYVRERPAVYALV